MKRIWSLPTKLKVAEAILPDWHAVPRSGKSDHSGMFPFEGTALAKYPTLNSSHISSKRFAELELSFIAKTQGIYEWTLICRGISKGSYSQANDKLYTYDKDTWAHFSMDIEDVLNLIMGMAQGRHIVTPSEDWYQIYGKFVMRWHFISPYTEEIEASFKKKDDEKKCAFKSKEITPSKEILYVDKNGNKFLFLWEAEYYRKWKSCKSMRYSSSFEDKEDIKKWNLFIGVREDHNGKIRGYMYFMKWKLTTVLSKEPAPIWAYDSCMNHLIEVWDDSSWQKDEMKRFVISEFSEIYQSPNYK